MSDGVPDQQDLEEMASLLDEAPTLPKRESPFMGLLETIAWAGSRDWRLADAVAWSVTERWPNDPIGYAATRHLLGNDLNNRYAARLLDVQAIVFDSAAAEKIAAKAQAGSGGFADVPSGDWIGAALTVESHGPDVLRLHSRHPVLSPYWTHVRFRRADVIALWPEPEPEPIESDPDAIRALPLYQRQMQVGPRYRLLHKFFKSAKSNGMLYGGNDKRSYDWLYERYKEYCATGHKNNEGVVEPVKPFRISAFKKWGRQFVKGLWGVEDGS